jgi:glycosyltransferase involved in cell wall biosynthesis
MPSSFQLFTLFFLLITQSLTAVFATPKAKKSSTQKEKTHICIAVASFNNEKWVEKNLTSLASQNYSNYSVIYTDDASTDKTSALARSYIKASSLKNKTIFIQNSERKRIMENTYNAVQQCPDDSIVMIVDGDDWLPHNNVLTELNEIYSDATTWVTWGSYTCYPSLKQGRYSRKLSDNEIIHIRRTPWATSHLRTFCAWLFKRIKKEDLMKDGAFLPCSPDLASMIPMIEMAGPTHARFITKVMYVYNETNPLSIARTRLQKTKEVSAYLRSLPPYQQIK